MQSQPEVQDAVASVQQTIEKLLSIKGKRTVDSFHRELGKIIWDYCGMARTADGPENSHRPDSAPCARSSGRTSPSPEPATTSTRAWKKPAA